MPGRFSHIPIANCETTETKCRDSHMPSDLRRPGFLPNVYAVDTILHLVTAGHGTRALRARHTTGFRRGG